MKKWWKGLDETDRSDVLRTAQILGCVAAAGFLILGVFPVLASLIGGLGLSAY